jgi:hypothetical protein
MEGSAPSETRGETTISLRAIDVGALTTLGTFGHTNWRNVMLIDLDQLAPYQGTTRD